MIQQFRVSPIIPNKQTIRETSFSSFASFIVHHINIQLNLLFHCRSYIISHTHTTFFAPSQFSHTKWEQISRMSHCNSKCSERDIYGNKRKKVNVISFFIFFLKKCKCMMFRQGLRVRSVTRRRRRPTVSHRWGIVGISVKPPSLACDPAWDAWAGTPSALYTRRHPPAGSTPAAASARTPTVCPTHTHTHN